MTGPKAVTPAHAGSTAWSGRVIYTNALEPVVTRLEATQAGARLIIESDFLVGSLPASAFILEKLAAKLSRQVIA
jgi:hypothetical protein